MLCFVFFLDAGLPLFARHCPARHRKAPQCSHLSNSCLRPLQKRQADQVSSSRHKDLPQLFLWTAHTVLVQVPYALLIYVCEWSRIHHHALHLTVNPHPTTNSCIIPNSWWNIPVFVLALKIQVCQFKCCISPSFPHQGSPDSVTYFIQCIDHFWDFGLPYHVIFQIQGKEKHPQNTLRCLL